MSLPAGSIPFSGTVYTSDSSDTYPTHIDERGQGGFRAVNDATARLAIPVERRSPGMWVHQISDDTYWQLLGGILDANWSQVSFGSTTAMYTYYGTTNTADLLTFFHTITSPGLTTVYYQYNPAQVSAPTADVDNWVFQITTSPFDGQTVVGRKHNVANDYSSWINKWNTLSWGGWVQLTDTNGNAPSATNSGWVPAPETWNSWDGVHLTISGMDKSSTYSPGMKIKLDQAQNANYQYPLNSAININDVLSGRNGSLIGVPTVSAATYGNAMTFNGATSAVSLNGGFQPAGGKYTISFRMFSILQGFGVNATLYQSWSQIFTPQGITVGISHGWISFTTGNGDGYITGIGGSGTVGEVCDGNEHLITISVNTNFAQVYVDGKLITSGVLKQPTYYLSNERIGCNCDNATNANFFHGYIYDFLIIDGYAIDQQTTHKWFITPSLVGSGPFSLTKIFHLTDVAYVAPDTTLTVYGGSDFVLLSHPVSNGYYSVAENPFNYISTNMYKYPNVSQAYSSNIANTAYACSGNSTTANNLTCVFSPTGTITPYLYLGTGTYVVQGGGDLPNATNAFIVDYSGQQAVNNPIATGNDEGVIYATDVVTGDVYSARIYSQRVYYGNGTTTLNATALSNVTWTHLWNGAGYPVAVDASTLTGTTLKSTITASNLSSLGTLTSNLNVNADVAIFDGHNITKAVGGGAQAVPTQPGIRTTGDNVHGCYMEAYSAAANAGDVLFGSDSSGGFIGSQNASPFSVRSNGAARITLNGATGAITFPTSVNGIQFTGLGTTGAAATAYLDGANNLLRSTSSIRYKTQVENLEDYYSETIYKMRPVWYKSLSPADNKDWGFYGFIAEEMAEVDPRLVHYHYIDDSYNTIEHPAIITSTGEITHAAYTERVLKADAKKVPDGVQYDRLTVMLVKEVQKLKAQNADLEQRLLKLEQKFSELT